MITNINFRISIPLQPDVGDRWYSKLWVVSGQKGIRKKELWSFHNSFDQCYWSPSSRIKHRVRNNRRKLSYRVISSNNYSKPFKNVVVCFWFRLHIPIRRSWDINCIFWVVSAQNHDGANANNPQMLSECASITAS